MFRKLLAVFVLSLGLFSCRGVEDDPNYPDYYNGKGTVYSYDGECLLGDFGLDNYKLQIDFTNGTSVLFDFPSVWVGQSGQFSLNTHDLAFASQDYYSEYGCYNICVAWDDYGYCYEYIVECDSDYHYSYEFLNVSDVVDTRASISFFMDEATYLTVAGIPKNEVVPFTKTRTILKRDDNFFVPYDYDCYWYDDSFYYKNSVTRTVSFEKSRNNICAVTDADKLAVSKVQILKNITEVEKLPVHKDHINRTMINFKKKTDDLARDVE